MLLYKRHRIIRVVYINTVIILYYRCETLCFFPVQSTTIFSNTIAGALGVMVMEWVPSDVEVRGTVIVFSTTRLAIVG